MNNLIIIPAYNPDDKLIKKETKKMMIKTRVKVKVLESVILEMWFI